MFAFHLHTQTNRALVIFLCLVCAFRFTYFLIFFLSVPFHLNKTDDRRKKKWKMLLETKMLVLLSIDVRVSVSVYVRACVHYTHWLHDANHLSYSQSNKNSINLLTPAVINLLGLFVCVEQHQGNEDNARVYWRKWEKREYKKSTTKFIHWTHSNDITWRDHLMVFCFHTYCLFFVCQGGTTFRFDNCSCFHFGFFLVKSSPLPIIAAVNGPVSFLHSVRTFWTEHYHYFLVQLVYAVLTAQLLALSNIIPFSSQLSANSIWMEIINDISVFLQIHKPFFLCTAAHGNAFIDSIHQLKISHTHQHNMNLLHDYNFFLRSSFYAHRDRMVIYFSNLPQGKFFVWMNDILFTW